MLRIGLTGRIASGKSTALSFFKALNVPVISADVINQALLEPGEPAFEAVKAHFGSSILKPNQTIHKRLLRQKIAQNEQEKQWIEALLHPLIHEKIKQEINQLKDKPYCVIEIPLLINHQDYPYLDRVLLIDVSVQQQLERLMKRDKLKVGEASALINMQVSREAYLASADDIIFNEGSDEAALKKQIKVFHRKYLCTPLTGNTWYRGTLQ